MVIRNHSRVICLVIPSFTCHSELSLVIPSEVEESKNRNNKKYEKNTNDNNHCGPCCQLWPEGAEGD